MPTINTASVVPGLSLVKDPIGPAFSAHPIRHWRKQLVPELRRGRQISMPFDAPGSTVTVGTCAQVGATSAYLLEKIVNDPLRPCCQTRVMKSASTILSKDYSSDTKGYLRSRCRTYDQQLTANKVPGINYINPVTGLPLNPTDSPTGPQVRLTQNCSLNCTAGNALGVVTQCNSVRKLNNIPFSKQGGVDSSLRIDRVKLAAITVNKANVAPNKKGVHRY